MNIQEDYRYPHPVLSSTTDDYTGGEFVLNKIIVHEDPSENSVEIEYCIDLDCEALENTIQNGMARIGLFVIADKVYYNQFHQIDSLNDRIQFAKGQLLGRVTFRAAVCAVEKIDDFVSEDIDIEFQSTKWSFEPGDVLAYTEQCVTNIGLDKLSKFESIFQFDTAESVPVGQVDINMEGEKISIVLNPEEEPRFSGMRSNSTGKNLLLSSVYLAVVMEVLSELSHDQPSYLGKKWFSVFSAKCDVLGIDLNNINPLRDAQRLLNSPFNILFDTEGAV